MHFSATLNYSDLLTLIQFINAEGLIISMAMGINEWLAPQISEHCP